MTVTSPTTAPGTAHAAPLAAHVLGPGSSGCGLLWIHTPRTKTRTDTACYLVAELPCGWEGRAFHLTPGGGQSDLTADGYDTLVCGEAGDGDQCEGKGFQRWGHCKHLTTLRTLIAGGQL